MTYELTNEEKRVIVNQNLKGLSNHKFSLELLMIEESSDPNVKESIINDIQDQINNCNLRTEALLAKLSEIN